MIINLLLSNYGNHYRLLAMSRFQAPNIKSVFCATAINYCLDELFSIQDQDFSFTLCILCQLLSQLLTKGGWLGILQVAANTNVFQIHL